MNQGIEIFFLAQFEKLHIVAGVCGSVFLLIPLLSKKGSKTHIWTGRIFAALMLFVVSSAITLSLRRVIFNVEAIATRKIYSYFQIYLGIFLFTSIEQGIIVFRKKRLNSNFIILKILIPVFFLAFSLVTCALGVWQKSLIFLVFGCLGSLLAIYQIRFWAFKKSDKMSWWFFHINNMFISCGLTLVALNLEIVSRLTNRPIETLSIWIWTAPIYILSPFVLIFLERERKRLFMT